MEQRHKDILVHILCRYYLKNCLLARYLYDFKCILTRQDTDMLYRGEHSLIQDAFTCPHCGVYGFKAAELSQHVM